MSVRIKIFLCLVGVAVLLWTCTSYLATTIFVEKFNKVDEQRLVRSASRVLDTLRETEQRLVRAAQVWALSTSLTAPSEESEHAFMQMEGLSLLARFNAEGKMETFSWGANGPLKGMALPLEDQAAFARVARKALGQETPVWGAVATSFGPMMVAAQRIQPRGPGDEVLGSLVTATLLDGAYEDALRSRLLLALSFTVPTEAEVSTESPVRIIPPSLNSPTMSAVALLRDMNNKPLLGIQITEARETFISGNSNLSFYLGATGAFTIAVVLIVTALLEFLVTGRLRRLTQSARKADQQGMDSLPPSLTSGHDEICLLARATKKMVERLRTSQLLYRAVVETQLELIVRYRPDGEITFANEAFARFFNRHMNGVIGRSLSEFFPTEAEETHALLETSEARPSTRARIQRLAGPDGKIRSIEWFERTIVDQDRAIQEVQAVGRDITERIEYEEKLQYAREAAEAADRAKGDFLAVIGHETRTPLTAILGFVNILENTPLNEEQIDYLSLINASGNSLLCLLNDLLDYSRMSAGEIELNKTTVSVVELVRELVALHIPQSRAKNLDLESAIHPGIPEFIEVDPIRLKQVIHSLIDNAIKFTEKGFIRLEVKAGQNGRIIFTVHDTGIGIPSDRQSALFKLFSQLEPALRRTHSGTGIGLVICKRLTEIMGGVISYESQSGLGSKFIIDLPIGSPAILKNYLDGESDLENGHLARRPSLQELKVLLVEDNPVNQKLAHRMLQMVGVNCDLASNGVECLEKTDVTDYNIIFMDVQMPIMDGFEAVRRLRQNEKNSNRPDCPRSYVVACTAFTLPGDREQCLHVGMDNYVGKPLRKEVIEGIITGYLSENLQPAESLPNGK